ncbi:putative pumilio-repeat, RNA-binding protein [Trypanosoma conorhini]|uniref:Putative pumilio-repeat, RNA-binding protein n=1 Tax=Trypanosoma conorhini TaxID=83891 RepID=A0A3R7MJM9_9TRYP|nr:putative pumilio-repeat, RNA-binding protein [Trypanosoma conorhini]RNF03697.1 putative pumilio-repeat, RNA-binding protein [Trypanosoma conorhini]
MERPPGPMHELIRRADDEIRKHSNYYAALRLLTEGLQFCEKDVDESGPQRRNAWRFALDQPDLVPGGHGHSNDVIAGDTSAGSFAESTASSRSTMLSVAEGGKVVRLAPQPRAIFNRTQKLRMLLLRADAYSLLRQHDKAIEDAQAAAQISHERCPEAYFVMGREYLRLFHLGASLAAFDKAEYLLSSLPFSHGNSYVEEVTDENFWAQRGYHMKDVERLKLNRRAMEQEEQKAHSALLHEEENNGMAAVSASQRALVTSTSAEGANPLLTQLVYWRQLAKEARALHSMNTSHILPNGFLQTALQFLQHQMSSVRWGAAVCIENTSSRKLRLIGCASPDAAFRNGMQFPETIPPGHCGVALLQPRGGWGGFVCSVCYEVADNGVCCFFCFETSFTGSKNCGVQVALERRSPAPGVGLREPNSSAAGTSPLATPVREFVGFGVPNRDDWLRTEVAPLPSGRQLKLSGETRSDSRVLMFTATEILAVRLRSVELLPALEFAGPSVLKKMSVVNQRYRELINNLPPPMFFGTGRCYYPDYCLWSDRTSSPWIVHDKEPVNWTCLFDGREQNRELFQVTDAADPKNIILYFSGESCGSVETLVFYGDRRTLIAQIKGSWVPFSSTLYLCTASGRKFASCFLDRNSELTLAWDGASKKNKSEDVEYVMHRIDPVRRTGAGARMGTVSNLSTVNGFTGTEAKDVVVISSASGVFEAVPSFQMPRSSRNYSVETYAVWRSQRRSGGSLGSSVPRQTNNGMELAAEVRINVPSTQSVAKGGVVAEISLCPGADALLVTLMTYCRSQWDG